MTDKTAARPTRAKPVRRKPAASSSARKPRAKRAKKTLGDDFLAAVRADFRAYGAGVIAEVRADKPDQYLKIVLSVLPRDFNATINQMDGLSDDEIRSRIRALEAVVKPFLEELGDGGQDGISGAAGGTGPQAPQ
ncbi:MULTISPECIES: hypothetical protein [unclassified Mesorhizobium]|uniref:hypothetical protein n=1 Tax=unclassified Mesorhizobium TaxID=325217 RepID=UPI001FCE29C8|nr:MULTISPECIES: hypothetical protein [unclassified Mesorhizobium]